MGAEPPRVLARNPSGGLPDSPRFQGSELRKGQAFSVALQGRECGEKVLMPRLQCRQVLDDAPG